MGQSSFIGNFNYCCEVLTACDQWQNDFCLQTLFYMYTPSPDLSKFLVNADFVRIFNSILFYFILFYLVQTKNN